MSGVFSHPMATCANCYAYNEIANWVRQGVLRGPVADALPYFLGSWVKSSDGQPDIARFEMCRGFVPPGIFLSRIAYDNPQFGIQEKKILGGRVHAGGLAVQPIEKYVQFDLDPLTGTGSLLLLLHRLRAIAEKRLKQYASIWDSAIFGACPPPGWFVDPVQRTLRFPDWPKLESVGWPWSLVERDARNANFEYVGEAVEAPPVQSEAASASAAVAMPVLICGGRQPPPFWPLELATKKGFWHLVLLEERTSEEVGNKFWKALIDTYGVRGQKLPAPVRALLVRKRKLYAPNLTVFLRSGLRNNPGLFAGTGYDASAVGGNLSVAEIILNSAGFIGASTFVNYRAWVPTYGVEPYFTLENENRAKIVDGDVRHLLVCERCPAPARFAVAPNVEGWGRASEQWAGTGGQYSPTAPLPAQPPVLPEQQEAILLPAPPQWARRGLSGKAKFAIALAAGALALGGVWLFRRK